MSRMNGMECLALLIENSVENDMFTLNKKSIVLELKEESGTVDIYANGECIAYFCEGGLVLLPDNSDIEYLPVDLDGYINIMRA